MKGIINKHKKAISWNIPAINSEELLRFPIAIIVLGAINLAVLGTCSSVLLPYHPESLGFRDTFTPIFIISGVSVLPIIATFMFGCTNIRLIIRFAGSTLFFLTIIFLYYSFGLNDTIELMGYVRNFKNPSNADVALLNTYYLAIYNDCCLIPDVDEVPPSLDCNSTDFQLPCYEDEELFEEFRKSLDVDDAECRFFTNFDPDKDESPFDKSCKRDVKSFVKKMTDIPYGSLWTLIITTVSYGFIALWYASEGFFWGIGDLTGSSKKANE